MANQPNHRAADRVRVELIEADVDIAFGLIDDALDEFRGGYIEFARRALENAENVLTDIDERLSQLEVDQRAPFGPLVTELRKSIRAAESECAS